MLPVQIRSDQKYVIYLSNYFGPKYQKSLCFLNCDKIKLIVLFLHTNALVIARDVRFDNEVVIVGISYDSRRNNERKTIDLKTEVNKKKLYSYSLW